MGRKRKTAAVNPKAKKNPPISIEEKAEKDRLFKLYVEPNLTNIKALSVKYTDKFQDAEDNYMFVLQQLYSYILTYDKTKPLNTWLHIVTKRACFNRNQKRARINSTQTEMAGCSSEAIYQHGTANIVDAGFGDLAENLSDEVYNALLTLEPRRLSAFLLYAQGLNIREITKIEYQRGHLDQKLESLIKSRIYWAKSQLRYELRKYGYTSSSITGFESDQFSDTDIDGEEV